MSSVHSTTQAQDQPERYVHFCEFCRSRRFIDPVQRVSPQPNENTMDLKSRPNDAANDHQAADTGHPNEEYPPQLHAGKVGLGPHYGEANRVTIGEQITGIRETIKGRLKHDSQLEERGHERITGELKRKEREKENDPFEETQDSAGAAKDDPRADEMPGNDKQEDKPQQQQA